jgi:type I restriction enzyme R subunit
MTQALADGEPPHQLPVAAIVAIIGVLQAHPRVERAALFGSRALDRARPGSDIDLAVWGALEQRELASILGELEELPLPWRFDLVHADTLRDEGLREHLARYARPLAL